MRYAVAHARSRKTVEAFLAQSFVRNYQVITDHDASPNGDWKNCVIEGEDSGYKTLGFVISVLGERGIRIREHADRNDAETAACAAMN